MTDTPCVSVVIIFLNAEKFIAEAVESVLAQTYDSWELLLADDGSTDRSTAIAKDYAQRYPGKVRYLEHPGHVNKGMSATRNLGITHARGEYLAFLDADDVWLPAKLEKQVTVLSRHPKVGMVFNPAFYWYSDGTRKPQPMTVPPGYLPPGAWLPRVLESDDNAACPSAIMMRKSLAVALGGFEASFKGPLMVVEDQAMWFKTSLAAPVYFDPECVLWYRIHAASCCGSMPATQLLAIRLHLYSWLAGFLKRSKRRHFSSLLFRTMARSRLCDLLLESAGQPADGANNDRPPGALTRLRQRLGTLGTYLDLLGVFFAGVLLAGAVSGRRASAFSRGLFAISKKTYDHGLWKALRSLVRNGT